MCAYFRKKEITVKIYFRRINADAGSIANFKTYFTTVMIIQKDLPLHID